MLCNTRGDGNNRSHGIRPAPTELRAETKKLTGSATNSAWCQTNCALQLRQKNLTRAGNVPALPFPQRTNIDNLQARGLFIQFMHTHLPNLCLFESCGLPRFHSTDQIPGKL